VAGAAERMKLMRQRRRVPGLRELRIVVTDPRSRAVRRRVAKQVAGLDPPRERDALQWIETISEFDADTTG
jgi:hypothetical protein